MNLLAGKLYDPSTAVTKATTAAAAMAAMDTTNLRLAITVPTHGMVRFRLQGVVHGATTFPSVLLGVMNGAAIIGRQAPMQMLGNTAVASAMVGIVADFIVTGLTPGAMNVDAAWGTETGVTGTGIKYGGPNNTTPNDAWGGFAFEAWDPQPLQLSSAPLQIDANGRVDIGEVLGTAVTAAAGRMEVNTTHIAGSAVNTASAQIGVNVVNYGGAAGTFAGGRPEVNVSHWRGTAAAAPATAGIPKVAIEAAGDFAQGAADKAWSTAARTLTAGTNIVLAKGTGVTGFNDLDAPGVRAAVGLALANLDTQFTSVLSDTGTLVARLTAGRALNLDNLDATISSRSTYAGGDTAGTTTLLTRLSAGRALNLDNLDATITSRFAAASYVAPDNASITAIKGKTDSLSFTVAGKVDTNVLVVNGVTIQGTGTLVDPWRAV